jgi:hypothetical protein
MPRKRHPDQNAVDDLLDAAYVAHGDVYTDPDGNVLKDADGYPLLDKKRFQSRVVEYALSLPMATKTKKPEAGTYAAILHAVMPKLKVDNMTPEEEACYHRLLGRVSTLCKISRGGKVQAALGSDEQNRVLCTGKIPVANAQPQPGIWLSDSSSPSGPVAAQWEILFKKWAEGIDPVLDWGNLATERQPALGKAVLAQVDAQLKEITAKRDTFRLKVLAAAEESNGQRNRDHDQETEPVEA